MNLILRSICVKRLFSLGLFSRQQYSDSDNKPFTFVTALNVHSVVPEWERSSINRNPVSQKFEIDTVKKSE